MFFADKSYVSDLLKQIVLDNSIPIFSFKKYSMEIFRV